MASKGQLTGMRGVYLVAAELSRLNLIASPTSRSAIAADILVTDQSCQNTFSIQVKTTTARKFWLLTSKTKDSVCKTHIYVLVSLRPSKSGEAIEYFVVPSEIVVEKTKYEKNKNSEWWAIYQKDVEEYRDKWSVFGVS